MKNFLLNWLFNILVFINWLLTGMKKFHEIRVFVNGNFLTKMLGIPKNFPSAAVMILPYINRPYIVINKQFLSTSSDFQNSLLLHEEGHLSSGHFNGRTGVLLSPQQEIEADAYAVSRGGNNTRQHLIKFIQEARDQFGCLFASERLTALGAASSTPVDEENVPEWVRERL